MRDALLKIAEYLEGETFRLQVLERKIEAIEKANEELIATNKDLADKVALLEGRIEELENRSVVTEEDEPEVEVELIIADDEQAEEIPTVTEPEPTVEPEPVIEPEKVIEPEPVAEPVQEPIIAETVTARAAEETKIKVPIQTSLFGTAVTDIRHGMAIGDRFLFQRELFGGNGEAMQKAFNDINECEDMASAVAYIDNLGWNKESTSYELFINYLRRRFDH